MAMNDTIRQVRIALREGRFTSEAAVSTGVVLRILQALGWPVFDTTVVYPQYPVKVPRGNTRHEDLALCRSDGQPLVFIEIKAVGKLAGADVQLFEYAFHQGVSFAVLTDGQEWHFYLPMEPGSYDERSVYKLDILEQDDDECIARFNRYLAMENVLQERNMENARHDRNAANRHSRIETALPRAWQQLIADSDNALTEILADKVEDLCGFKPDLDTCADFLKDSITSWSGVARDPDLQTEPRSLEAPPEPGFTGFVLRGRRYPYATNAALMRGLFDELSARDSTFLERFAARKHGAKRRYLAADKYDLYPDRRDFCDKYSYELAVGGWFLSTHWNKAVWEKIANLACEVARLRPGEDVAIHLAAIGSVR